MRPILGGSQYASVWGEALGQHRGGGGQLGPPHQELQSWGGPWSYPQLGRGGRAFMHQRRGVTEPRPPGKGLTLGVADSTASGWDASPWRDLGGPTGHRSERTRV